MRCPSLFAAVFLALVAAGAPSALAQEATPAVATDRAAFVPGPEECTVEPRSAEDLAALAATPDTGTPAAPGTPPAVPFGAPDGEPADPALAAELTALVRQEWACLNADDFPRTLALYTDDLVRRFFPPEALEGFGAARTPEALPAAEQTALFAVLDVELLGEGQAGAFVIVDTAGDPLPVEVNYYVFTEGADGWLMDDFVCFDEEGMLC